MSRRQIIWISVSILIVTGLVFGSILLVRNHQRAQAHAKQTDKKEKGPTPAEQVERMRQYREKISFRLEELRCKQALGMLSESDNQTLSQIEDRLKKMDQEAKAVLTKAALKRAGSETKSETAAKKSDRPTATESQNRRESWQNLTPAERQARWKEAQPRIEKQIAELQKKKTEGTLTPDETRRLERLTSIQKQMTPSP